MEDELPSVSITMRFLDLCDHLSRSIVGAILTPCRAETPRWIIGTILAPQLVSSGHLVGVSDYSILRSTPLSGLVADVESVVTWWR